jgi:hypothetical protein
MRITNEKARDRSLKVAQVPSNVGNTSSSQKISDIKKRQTNSKGEMFVFRDASKKGSNACNTIYVPKGTTLKEIIFEVLKLSIEYFHISLTI